MHDRCQHALSGARPLVEVPRFSVSGLREEAHHLLLWQARGRTQFVVDGAALTLTAGTALWLPARTEHRFTTASNSALLPMFFDARRFTIAAGTPTVVSIDANAETLCLALISSQYSLVQPSADLEEMVLGVVEVHIAAPADTAMPRSLPALRVARNVILNPADQRTITDWATELHLSTRTLERLFLAETGLSWHRWRQTYRMLRAAQLLASTPLHVTDIARRVGYFTPSAFSRAFRERHSVTPTRYRELMGAGEDVGGRFRHRA